MGTVHENVSIPFFFINFSQEGFIFREKVFVTFVNLFSV